MKLIIVGASTLGRSTIHIVRAEAKYDVIGVVDDIAPGLQTIEGVPFIGSTEILFSANCQFADSLVIVAVGLPAARRDILARLTRARPDVQLATVIHPSVILLGQSRVQKGCIIFPGCVISSGVDIGEGVLINSNASIGAGTNIGACSTIGPNVSIGSEALLEREVYIGMGSAIAQQVHLHDRCVVGALSFVRDHVNQDTTVVGSPARVKGASC